MSGNFSISYGLNSNPIANMDFGGDYKIRNGNADGLHLVNLIQSSPMSMPIEVLILKEVRKCSGFSVCYI